MERMKVVYPRYYPHVSSKCGSEFPPLAVTRNCIFPGLMVEVSFKDFWGIINLLKKYERFTATNYLLLV